MQQSVHSVENKSTQRKRKEKCEHVHVDVEVVRSKRKATAQTSGKEDAADNIQAKKRKCNVSVKSKDQPTTNEECVTAADKKNGNTAKVKRSGRRKHVDEAEIKHFKVTERKRKQRRRIASDENALAMSRLYDRYIKRKADGKIKPVAERSEREQRHQRKLWRANSKRSYKKRLTIAREAAAVQQLESSTCHQAASGKKRAKANSAKLKRKCDRLQNELQTAKKLAEKWKKRYSRLQSNPAAGSLSPKTVVQRVVTR